MSLCKQHARLDTMRAQQNFPRPPLMRNEPFILVQTSSIFLLLYLKHPVFLREICQFNPQRETIHMYSTHSSTEEK